MALSFVIFSLVACLLHAAGADAKGYSGKATAYTSSFGSQENACGFSSRDIGHFSKNFISIDTDHFAGGDVCGRCIRVRGTESGASGNSVLFKIVDECASGCEGHGVDMSTGGLKAVTGFSWDRKGVNWEWASCSEPLVVKSGSSVRWSKSKSKRGRKMMEAEAALN